MSLCNVHIYKNGIIYPREEPEKFGCADNDLNFIPESLLYRNYGVYGKKFKPVKPTEFVDEKVIYGGHLMAHHYGHFIIDSLSRLSYAKNRPCMPICWSSNEHECSYMPYENDILKYLGIKNKTIFVTQATQFAELHIPEPEYIIADFFSEEHKEFLSCVPSEKIIPGKKIYLSRRKIVPTADNEEELEDKLAKQGFIIFYPEQHSVAEQLYELSSSEVITGIMGSAFHTLMLIQDLKSRILLLSRPQWVDGNYKFIADRKGWNQYIFDDVWIERKINKDTPHLSTGILDIDKILSYFEKYGRCRQLYQYIEKFYSKSGVDEFNNIQNADEKIAHKINKNSKINKLKSHIKRMINIKFK